MLRRAIALIMALLLTVAVAACAPERESPDPTAQALAKGLAAKDVSTVAFADATGAQVQEQLAELTKGMDAWKPNVTVASVEEVESNLFRATLSMTGRRRTRKRVGATPPQRTCTMRTTAGRCGEHRKVAEPSLAEGERLVLATKEPQRGQILDADGEAIVRTARSGLSDRQDRDWTSQPPRSPPGSWQRWSDVDARCATRRRLLPTGRRPSWTRSPFARAPSRSWTSGSWRASTASAPWTTSSRWLPEPYLRRAGAGLRPGGHGGGHREIRRQGGGGQTVGSSGLQAAFNKELSGTPGVTVSAVAQPAEEGADAPTRQLFRQDPADGKDLKSTLVPDLQSAAEDILANAKSPSSIVALRPSTGAVLAAANGPDSEGYNTAFLASTRPVPPSRSPRRWACCATA